MLGKAGLKRGLATWVALGYGSSMRNDIGTSSDMRK
jgi:hypothetical protein